MNCYFLINLHFNPPPGRSSYIRYYIPLLGSPLFLKKRYLSLTCSFHTYESVGLIGYPYLRKPTNPQAQFTQVIIKTTSPNFNYYEPARRRQLCNRSAGFTLLSSTVVTCNQGCQGTNLALSLNKSLRPIVESYCRRQALQKAIAHERQHPLVGNLKI